MSMRHPYIERNLTSARKALGQLERVKKMIDDEKYCINIIQQIRAVEGLLNTLTLNILEEHLHTCAKKAFRSKDPKEQEKIVKEIVSTLKKNRK
jgi:DNA-binding FrmR family transcriptional regulator